MYVGVIESLGLILEILQNRFTPPADSSVFHKETNYFKLLNVRTISETEYFFNLFTLAIWEDYWVIDFSKNNKFSSWAISCIS